MRMDDPIAIALITCSATVITTVVPIVLNQWFIDRRASRDRAELKKNLDINTAVTEGNSDKLHKLVSGEAPPNPPGSPSVVVNVTPSGSTTVEPGSCPPEDGRKAPGTPE